MKAAVSLGSNIGDKRAYIEKAIKKLANTPQIGVLAVSEFYRTEPVDYLDQDWFVNAVALLETKLEPEELLNVMLSIEDKLGRKRDIPKGPRTIDLDLLLYEDQIIEAENLTLPHPEMDKRRFVLKPLASIAGNWIHPVRKKSIDSLLDELQSESRVELL